MLINAGLMLSSLVVIAIPTIGYIIRIEKRLAVIETSIQWIVRKLNGIEV